MIVCFLKGIILLGEEALAAIVVREGHESDEVL